MGRYDFLDEELRKKLEEKQKELISNRKKEEVKESKEKKDEDKEGPTVYTKEDGSIGGVIYPEGEEKPRKETKSAAEEILGSEEEENNPGNKNNPQEEEDLPVKLHHTKETKVGSEDRPKPKMTEEPVTKLPQEKEEKDEGDEVQGARESIWQ
ncbi:MAG: hypothetical protein ACLFQ8_02345 [Candidatus Aenigmatarchaeota archaeon]